MVTPRLEDGRELPCVVDTGSPVTLLAESLEPDLGPCLGTHTLWNFGDRYDANGYAAPRLYLGGAPLVADSNVLTSDCVEKLSSDMGRPVMGILGMDCLQHYCIQLDFKAGKMRFLKPDRVKAAKLGKAFVLTFSSRGNSDARWIRPYIHWRHLVGPQEADLLIDTGYDRDGALTPELFRQKIREHTLQMEADANDAREPKVAYLPKCVWSGNTYTDLAIANGRHATEPDRGGNLLGLRFLARHLVTFDFPRRTMYLKQRSTGPLVSRETTAAGRAAAKSAYRYGRHLMKSGRLPGWSKQDRGAFSKTAHFSRYPETITFTARKRDDPSIYHYEFTRASKDDPWKLHQAWRTHQDDRMIEEYPVP
ncbi:MAG: hypothetical protein A2Y77_16195 [Planctomycetes bacterium RBG_13_62_9]|nr:MAG: hypothetical protein A2Y77_16195 [Planctomycetes bacterium RBG_13_62_9]